MAYAPKTWEVGELMVDEKLSTIVHKHDFSTGGTSNKLREVNSCFDFSTDTTISTMVMTRSGLCGMKSILY
jgi:hypothetical protein